MASVPAEPIDRRGLGPAEEKTQKKNYEYLLDWQLCFLDRRLELELRKGEGSGPSDWLFPKRKVPIDAIGQAAKTRIGHQNTRVYSNQSIHSLLHSSNSILNGGGETNCSSFSLFS